MALRSFTKGAIEKGGDVWDIGAWGVDIKNEGKVVHTRRKSGAGVTTGNVECDVNFEYPVGFDGSATDAEAECAARIGSQLTFIRPDGVHIPVDGIVSATSAKQDLQGEYKVSVTFTGTTDAANWQ